MESLVQVPRSSRKKSIKRGGQGRALAASPSLRYSHGDAACKHFDRATSINRVRTSLPFPNRAVDFAPRTAIKVHLRPVANLSTYARKGFKKEEIARRACLCSIVGSALGQILLLALESDTDTRTEN